MARTPNVKVELDISASHRKDVVRITLHSLTWPSQLVVKARRAFLKAKVSGVNEAAKGILNNEVEQQLQYLLREAEKNSEDMKYLTEVVEYVAKHSLPKGIPPPPARPPALPKEGAKARTVTASWRAMVPEQTVILLPILKHRQRREPMARIVTASRRAMMAKQTVMAGICRNQIVFLKVS
ncbi:hypothetical protein ACFX2I_008276 [Malus domestica]